MTEEKIKPKTLERTYAEQIIELVLESPEKDKLGSLEALLFDFRDKVLERDAFHYVQDMRGKDY